MEGIYIDLTLKINKKGPNLQGTWKIMVGGKFLFFSTVFQFLTTCKTICFCVGHHTITSVEVMYSNLLWILEVRTYLIMYAQYY